MDAARGLRRDAEDNRRRLLSAAREVFAEQGLDATLHDVARRAGVGVGTAYRRFANKEELVDAILVDQVDDLEAALRSALAETDAWTGVTRYLERSVAIQAGDRAIAQILSGQRLSQERHDWQRNRLAPLVDELAHRAVASGAVRPDLTGTDLIFVQIGLVAIAQTTRGTSRAEGANQVDDLYRRYLWIALDGIRADGPRSPLPVDALTTDQTHQLLSPAPDRPGGTATQ